MCWRFKTQYGHNLLVGVGGGGGGGSSEFMYFHFVVLLMELISVTSKYIVEEINIKGLNIYTHKNK